MTMKRRVWAAASAAMMATTAFGAQAVLADKYPNGQVKVFNWGEYIDEDVITQFEDETGISVIYDVFETNEEMYPVIEAGGVAYDAVCPSDYMIQKMIENDLLADALNSLPQDNRDILLMYWFLEMADREIAERMNLARRTINNRRLKSYRLLKELMGGDTDA